MPALRTIHQKATVIDGRVVVEVPIELNGKQLDITLVEVAEQVIVDKARIERQLAWLKSFAGKYTGPVDVKTPLQMGATNQHVHFQRPASLSEAKGLVNRKR